MKGSALDAARGVLSRLRSKDPDGYYSVPVDTRFLTDYLDIIKTPMDLGLVESRLESYEDMRDFIRDLRLVYDNSKMYCKTRFPVLYKLAIKLGKQLDKEIETHLAVYINDTATLAQLAAHDEIKLIQSRILSSIKRHRHSAYFREPVDIEAFIDYPSRVEKVMDLSLFESLVKDGDLNDSPASYIRELRRIASNCIRFNSDPRHREVRDAGLEFLHVIEKEIETKLRPAIKKAIATMTSTSHSQKLEITACPPLHQAWPRILQAIENSILNEYEPNGQQTAYAFLHPIESYYDTQSAIDYYRSAVPRPMSVGQVVGNLICEASYSSVAALDTDMKLVFANCLTYFGPSGAGRAAHGNDDANAYCDISRKLDAKWRTAVAPLLLEENKDTDTTTLSGHPSVVLQQQKNNNTSSSASKGRKSPSPPSSLNIPKNSNGTAAPATKTKAPAQNTADPSKKKKPKETKRQRGLNIDAVARGVLTALREHRMTDGYATTTPFATAAILPKSNEYFKAIGKDNSLDLQSIERRLSSYSTLDDFANDITLCFENARKWRTHLTALRDAGELEAKHLSETELAQAAESVKCATMLGAVLELALDDAKSKLEEESSPSKKKRKDESKKRSRAQESSVATGTTRKPNSEAKAVVSPIAKPKKNKGAHTAVGVEAAPPRRGKQIILNPKPRDDDDEDDFSMPEVGSKALVSGGSATKKPRPTNLPNLMEVVQGTEPWREGAAKILNRLSRHEWIRRDSEWGARIRWYEAVAEVFPALREAYLAKIKNPSDLGLVERTLRQGGYKDADDFVVQLIRVFENAVRFNADAKKNPSTAPDDYASKIHDIAAHLKDWCSHLVLEFLLDPANPAKRNENYVCALDAAELGAAREREALRREQQEQEANTADLDASALASFVSKQQSASSKSNDTKEPKTAANTTSLTEEKRHEARRLRDEIVWPSRLQYNHKANVQAKKVIKALRQQSYKKHSQAFEEMVSTALVPDYTQFVAEPTSIKRVEQRLALSLSADNLTPEATSLLPEYETLVPYETLGEMAMELRRVFSNALKYNARYRADPNSRGAQICEAVELLSPILEDALYALAFEAYDRVRSDRIVGDWNRLVAEQARIETQRKELEMAEMRREAQKRYQEVVKKPKLANQSDRLRILRGLSLLGVETLDIMTPDEATLRQKNIKLLTKPKPLLRRESSMSITGHDDIVLKHKDEAQLPAVSEELSPGEMTTKAFSPFRLLVRSHNSKASATPLKSLSSFELHENAESDNNHEMPDIVRSSNTPEKESDEALMINPENNELDLVEAIDGDTGWFEFTEQGDVEARVFISAYQDHDVVRCSVVLRAPSAECLDFSLVAFAYTANKPTRLKDSFFAAATAKRHHRLTSCRSQLILDLAALPFTLHPKFSGLAITPPLPSRREGLPYLEQIFVADYGTLSLSFNGLFTVTHPALYPPPFSAATATTTSDQ